MSHIEVPSKSSIQKEATLNGISVEWLTGFYERMSKMDLTPRKQTVVEEGVFEPLAGGGRVKL